VEKQNCSLGLHFHSREKLSERKKFLITKALQIVVAEGFSRGFLGNHTRLEVEFTNSSAENQLEIQEPPLNHFLKVEDTIDPKELHRKLEFRESLIINRLTPLLGLFLGSDGINISFRRDGNGEPEHEAPKP